MDYRIFPPEEILETSLSLPLSKSISARTLIMAALGATLPENLADCDDTKAMHNALRDNSDYVNIGHAGTAMRFLTAYYAAIPDKKVTLDGSERMRQRPIAPLVDTLRMLGADIKYIGEEDYPPLEITGRRLSGGKVEIDATISSQFISAILMVAPTMLEPLNLKLLGETFSMPYINMTVKMMNRCGIDAEISRDTITVCPGKYQGGISQIERDWSAAAFWYEITALTAGWVTLTGIDKGSIQGDRALVDIFPKLGVLTEFDDDGAELSPTPDIYGRLDIDLADTPDLVQAIAVTACAVGIPFTITGVKNLRFKETDRIDSLCRELLKIGCPIETIGDNTISWDGRRIPVVEMPQIDTYNDHRMAMAFAPLSVFVPGIVIRDVEVVEKSYPDYWQHLRDAGFTLTDASEE